ncbi:MAG: ABC transporter permease [Acidobacteria bacterium]|nr:ABC transporter permease [Acidobacteriota bacterium]
MPQIRFAIRSLARHPALMLAAILTIAAGVGSNAVIFSLIRAVLLRPLPYRDPARLVYLWQTHPTLGNLQVAWPDYLDFRNARSFESVETYTFEAMNKVALTGEGAPIQLQATMVSAGLLPMLGVTLASGALPASNRPSDALISEALWRRKFSADPNIAGRVIRVSGQDLTIAGVVATRTAFPVWADLWLPISMLEPQLRETRRFHPLEVVARLKPGVTLAAAQAEMASIAQSNAAAHAATNRNMGAFVTPMLEQVAGPVRPLLLIIWMAAGLILLMACANVAHLLLTRTLARSRELAIRVSLGASWKDIATLLGAESLVLALAGSAAGAAVAGLSLPVLRDLAARRIPRIEDITFDRWVALYAVAAALLMAFVVTLPGLARAFQRTAPSASRYSRTGAALLISEVALSFVVFVSALLLTRNFAALLNVDKGFDTTNVLAVATTLPPDPGGWEAAAELFQNRLAPAIRSLPGVETVATANMAPMSLESTQRMRYATRFGLAGVAYREGAYPVAQLRWVSADYFATLRIPYRAGRPLTAADRNQPVCAINETLARQYFGGHDPVGRQILTGMGTPKPTASTVVAVIGAVRDLDAASPPPPAIYSINASPGDTLLIRTTRDPMALAQAVEKAVHQVVPDAPVTRVRTVDRLVSDSLARPRFALEAMSVFAGIAALLAVIGINGVVSYSVGRRVVEFAVRSAVGASPRRLMLEVAIEASRIAVLGILAGAALFSAVSRLFRTLVIGASPLDPAALAGAAVVLALLTAAALAAPARRASRIAPALALRDA